MGETPSIGAVLRFVSLNWNHVQKPKGFLHDDGYFIVHFTSVSDKNAVLYGGPSSLNNGPIIIKPWTLSTRRY